MKKYYAEFIHQGILFVIRFKVDRAVDARHFDYYGHLFIDHMLFPEDPFRCRSLTSIVTEAATGRVYIEIGSNEFTPCARLLTREEFIQLRSLGVPRWKPVKENFYGC